MRDKKYVTMMDPFQIRYGRLLSGALVLPALLVDVLWVSCTLLGLGKHTLHIQCAHFHYVDEGKALIFVYPCLWVCLTGATMSVILDLPYVYTVWISSAVAIIYTLSGGLYSVAYTDVIQLSLIFVGLVSYNSARVYFEDIHFLQLCTVKHLL